MHELVTLRSTFESEDDAQAAARKLIDKRVAACAHVTPIWSTYRWKGTIEAGSEYMLEARTVEADVEACWDALLDGHPYENPLVEILPPAAVPARYAEWAARCTKR